MKKILKQEILKLIKKLDIKHCNDKSYNLMKIRHFKKQHDSWGNIASYKYLSQEFINTFANQLLQYSPLELTKIQTLSDDFILKYYSKIRHYVFNYQQISEELLLELTKKYSPNTSFDTPIHYASLTKIINHLSTSFFIKNKRYFDWKEISAKNREMKLYFLKENKHRIQWHTYSKMQHLNEEVIEKFKDSIDWIEVSKKEFLYTHCLEKYKDKLIWQLVCKHNKFIVNLKNLIKFEDLVVFPTIIERIDLKKDARKFCEEKLKPKPLKNIFKYLDI